MKVELTKKAVRQLDRLNEPLKSRIIYGLRKLELEPPEGDIKELKGRPGVFRLRVGEYRLLYMIETDCIIVFKIAPRGQAYKGE